MSDRNLSESEWKKFSKGRAYKDAAWIKALDVLEAAGDDPQRQLDAIAGVEKEADALRKANKGDKDLAGYLDDAAKSLQKQRVAAAAQAKAGGDEDDGPAALTSQMVPLLRQVAAGNTMQVLLGITSKQVVVLMSRKPISTARRKLLTTYADDASGMKFAAGQCLFEAGMHTFVVEAKASGLAKRVRAALLQQTEVRWKVRVRGLDPNDVDEDGDDAEAGKVPQAPPLPQAAEPASTAAIDTKAISARLAALQAAVRQALTGPAANEVRAAVAELTQHIKGGDGAAAQQALARLESLVPAGTGAAPAAGASQAAAAAPAPAAKPGGAVDYARCRLAWEAARKKVHGELQSLERLVLDHYRQSSAIGELTVKIRRLDTVLSGFEEDLDDLLDAALNTDSAERKRELHAEAARVVRKFLARAQSDPVIQLLETNPFQPVSVKATLVSTLDVLTRRLA